MTTLPGSRCWIVHADGARRTSAMECRWKRRLGVVGPLAFAVGLAPESPRASAGSRSPARAPGRAHAGGRFLPPSPPPARPHARHVRRRGRQKRLCPPVSQVKGAGSPDLCAFVRQNGRCRHENGGDQQVSTASVRLNLGCVLGQVSRAQGRGFRLAPPVSHGDPLKGSWRPTPLSSVARYDGQLSLLGHLELYSLLHVLGQNGMNLLQHPIGVGLGYSLARRVETRVVGIPSSLFSRAVVAQSVRALTV